MKTVMLPSLPAPLTWYNRPLDWRMEGDGLSITAGPRTDLFTDPAGANPVANSPWLLMPVAGDFMLSARVMVDFAATFDAGVLLIYADPQHWAKLCFEYSPLAESTTVSVVTRMHSDDCNSAIITDRRIHLRVARMDDTWAFHSSPDGGKWSLIRYFGLGPVGEVAVGFSAQSPRGEGCRAEFDEIRFRAHTLADLRDGT